jgi:hypothetical protein
MNEGFSDMGCVCGIFCGSKINMVNRRRHRKKGKTALRSMSNPKLEGQQTPMAEQIGRVILALN